jgi:hypothetical protein
MFRIGTAEDVAVGVIGDEGGHVAPDLGEVRDHAVVHEDVSAENEGVRVHLRDDATAARAYVGENALRLSVFAQGFKVEVVDGRALGLV